MAFMTAAILSGLAWDAIKSSGYITAEYIRKKLNGWIVKDEDIEKITEKLNDIPEPYKKNEKFLKVAIEEDETLLEIINTIKKDFNNQTNINVQGVNLQQGTMNNGGSNSNFNTTNNYYHSPKAEDSVMSRPEVRKVVEKILLENATTFEVYGPTDENRFDISNQKQEVWREYAKNIIIPNNDLLIKVIEENFDILTVEEKKTLIKFKLHAQGFKNNQDRDVRIAEYPQFPIEINEIFK